MTIEQQAEAYAKSETRDKDLQYKLADAFIEGANSRTLPVENVDDKLFIWDGINCELEEIESVTDARTWVKENLTDPEEGIHPDAESVYLLKQIGQVVVNPVEGKDTYTIKMDVEAKYSIADQIKQLNKDSAESRQVNADLSYTNGVHFGYPHCCIKEYCEDLLTGRNPGKLRNIDGSGFIPCQKHYEEIKDGKIELQSLVAQSAPSVNPALPTPEEVFQFAEGLKTSYAAEVLLRKVVDYAQTYKNENK